MAISSSEGLISVLLRRDSSYTEPQYPSPRSAWYPLTSLLLGIRWLRICMPPLAVAPNNLNLSFSSKSPNSFVVQRNSLRGMSCSRLPPTMAPSRTRNDFGSPSQFFKSLPSNSLMDFTLTVFAVWACEQTNENVLKN